MDIIREPKGIQEFTGACELSGQHVVWREKKKSALTGVLQYLRPSRSRQV